LIFLKKYILLWCQLNLISTIFVLIFKQSQKVLIYQLISFFGVVDEGVGAVGIGVDAVGMLTVVVSDTVELGIGGLPIHTS
jgi:hypothetical protein